MLSRLTCSSIFILLSILLQKSHANCSPSSCGNIPNISFPFRLQNDPKHCGVPSYELNCHNNLLTVPSTQFKNYEVKAINYDNFTIRIADASINNTNTCSFPKLSISPAQYPRTLVLTGHLWGGKHADYSADLFELAEPINFMRCPKPMKNSTDSNACAAFTYIKAGRINASDVGHMCTMQMFAMTSWKFKDFNNVSLSEIHDSLLYGIELSWNWYPCTNCKNIPRHCYLEKDHTTICDSNAELIQIVLICITVLILLGICISVWYTLVIICLFGLLYLAGYNGPGSKSILPVNLFAVGFYIVIFIVARLIIGFIWMLWSLIYKFRRRHLSVFDVIESFLRSDNELVPIRYSYSNIKKITKNFREELGQGGYGKVYKGKLRSGHDVAVKLLGKKGANGQDFMNEIATIGRIHHVNVVKLVGYCAEGSKRALVYDFMPKGSLDKYIYSNGVNALDLQRKYDIAIGVARGIEYLHRGCDIQILHFDIKPHNVLLDDKFIPKISDFGLAKIFSTQKETMTLTAARGTIGYVAPELINRGFGNVSYKADVYSFGMLLIEMLCLKKDLRRNDEQSTQYFPDWIYDNIRDVEIDEINPKDDNTRRIGRKMTIVALWCIQMSPHNRPCMNQVLGMLEGDDQRLEIPQQPTQVVLDVDQSLGTYSSTDSTSLIHHDAATNFEITVLDL